MALAFFWSMRTPTAVLRLVLFLLLATLVLSTKNITVHIIPHTHDDVGWVKTPSQYYDTEVRAILDNTIRSLHEDPSRTFTYVEVFFLERWWRDQNSTTRAFVQELVRTGRLELLNGGWCMNDEATPTLQTIVDQMTLGHQVLLQTFNITPTIGWHIDPFGHSSTMASVMASLGFDAFFFQKIDFQQWSARSQTKQLEFIWRPQPSRGERQDIFTHILHNNNDGYTWRAPYIDSDPSSPSYNLTKVANTFLADIQARHDLYRTDHVIFLFGTDFYFQDAPAPFLRFEKIQEYFADHPELGINVKYSTPSAYIQAVHNEQLTWDVFDVDYFPCSFREHYAEKRLDRSLSALLHSAWILDALAQGDGEQRARDLFPLWSALSVHQHHDAMPGTDLQFVSDAYVANMTAAAPAAGAALTAAASVLLTNGQHNGNVALCRIPALSDTAEPLSCPPAEVLNHSNVNVHVFNPHPTPVSLPLSLPVPSKHLVVLGPDTRPLPAQIVPHSDTSSPTPFTLHWLSPPLAPLALTTFSIVPTTPSFPSAAEFTPPVEETGTVLLDNGRLKAVLVDGQLVQLGDASESVVVNQSWGYFLPDNGDAVSKDCSSAYAFRPQGVSITPMASSQPRSVSVVRGPVVSTATTVISDSDSVTQTVSLFHGGAYAPYAVLDTDVGPLAADAPSPHGKEVFLRFSTELDSGRVFFTDSNGEELVQRQVDHHPGFNETVYEPVAANVYPATSLARLADAKSSLTLATDRSLGVTSLGDGELDVMMHRRLVDPCHEDEGYELDDLHPVSGRFLIAVSASINAGDDARSYRTAQSLSENPPTLLVDRSKTQPQSSRPVPLAPPPPSSALRLVTLHRMAPHKFLLRWGHRYSVGDGVDVASPFRLDDILWPLHPHGAARVVETQLSGAKALSDVQRLQWKTAASTPTPEVDPRCTAPVHEDEEGRFAAWICPMQIRSFVVDMQSEEQPVPIRMVLDEEGQRQRGLKDDVSVTVQPNSTLLAPNTTSLPLTVNTSDASTCTVCAVPSGTKTTMSGAGTTTHTTTLSGLHPVDTNVFEVDCDGAKPFRLAFRSLPHVSSTRFPRRGNLWGSYQFAKLPPSYGASRVDLWLGATFDDSFMAALRQANPSTLLLTSVNACEHPDGLPEEYYLHNISRNDPPSTRGRLESWPGSYRLDMTKPYVQQYQARIMYELVLLGGSEGQPAGNLTLPYDGIFVDNVFLTQSWAKSDIHGNPFYPDTTGTGKPDDPKTFDAEWGAGILHELALFREVMPHAIMDGHALDLSNPAIVATFNAISVGFMLPLVVEGLRDFADAWSQYEAWMTQPPREPRVTMMESAVRLQLGYGYGFDTQLQKRGQPGYMPLPTYDFARHEYKYMRFGLCFTLMQDGYFTHEMGDSWHGQDWHYDEEDFDLGWPLAGPTHTNGTVSLWRRDFTCGVVLVNPTDTVATLDGLSNLRRLSGEQAPLYQITLDDSSAAFDVISGHWTPVSLEHGYDFARPMDEENVGPYFHTWRASAQTSSPDAASAARFMFEAAEGKPAWDQRQGSAWSSSMAVCVQEVQANAHYSHDLSCNGTSTTVNLQSDGGDEWVMVANGVDVAGTVEVVVSCEQGTVCVMDGALVESEARYNNGAQAVSVQVGAKDGIILAKDPVPEGCGHPRGKVVQ